MPSRKPDMEGLRKFKEYRDKGISYRDIEKIMKKPLVTLWRWEKYIKAGILSTNDKTKVIHT
jgi:hypothetical protein